MLYGFTNGGEVIVIGADSMKEYEVFRDGVAVEQDAEILNGFAAMTDARCKYFDFCIIFDDTSAYERFGITEVDSLVAKSRHRSMVESAAPDDDDRTFAEIYGIRDDEENKWDKRTLEQKARDKLMTNLSARARQADGDVTPESFKQVDNDDPNVKGPKLINIDAIMDEVGRLHINATYEKGDPLAYVPDWSPRPWLPDYDTTQFFDHIADPDTFKALTANEFIFAVAPTADGSLVSIAPKQHFEENQEVFEPAMWPMIRHLLPRDCREVGERTFASDLSVEDARNQFAAAGFEHSNAYAAVLNKEIQRLRDRASARGRAIPDDQFYIPGKVSAWDGELQVGQGSDFDQAEDVAFISMEPVMLTADKETVERIIDMSMMSDVEYENDGDDFVFEDHRLAGQVILSLDRRALPYQATCDGEDYRPNPAAVLAMEKGMISIFFRMDVVGADGFEIIRVLEEGDLNVQGTIMRLIELDDRVVVVCPFEKKAKQARKILIDNGNMSVDEPYGVNAMLERLIDEDANAKVKSEIPPEDGPRLWNDRAHELALMTHAQLEAFNKEIHPQHFYYAVKASGKDVICYIVPKTVFDKDRSLWDGELPRHITRGLEPYFDRVGPSQYRVRRATVDGLSTKLNNQGLIESLYLYMETNDR